MQTERDAPFPIYVLPDTNEILLQPERRESNRNRERLGNKVVQPTDTQRKEAEITAIGAMDDPPPVFEKCDSAQASGPLLGSALFVWQMNAPYALTGALLIVVALGVGWKTLAGRPKARNRVMSEHVYNGDRFRR